MTNQTHTRRTRRGLIAASAALVLTLAACGSGEAEDASTGLPTGADAGATSEQVDDSGSDDASDRPELSEADTEKVFAEYEKCMADNGITMQTAGDTEGAFSMENTSESGPSGEAGDQFAAPPEDFEAAEEECNPILEDAFGSFEMSPEQEAEMADQMLDLQRCMADAGYELDLEGNSFTIGAEDGDGFEDALKECDKVAFGENSEVAG